MKRIIVSLIMVLPSFVFAQSVYMHEAQSDGSNFSGLDTVFSFLGIALLAFLVLFILPLVVREKIDDARTSKKIERQMKIDKERKLAEKQVAINTMRANAVPKAIDLGLSVKWSDFNFLAYESVDIGGYFKWGDVVEYGKESYSLRGKDFNDIGDINGNPQYDIVSKSWGNGWRTPTKDEFQELIEKCKSSIKEINGINGISFESTNGNSIFLPSTGYFFVSWELSNPEKGCYWSSTPKEKFKDSAYSMSFGGNNQIPVIGYSAGRIGKAIRPVKD